MKTKIETDDQKINDELLQQLPQCQAEKVFNQDMADIEPCFLGFVEVYYHLSQIIPKHFTIVDLGCAYNPQCFYFKDHKKYIAVDIFPERERFKSDNCIFYEMSIRKFIKEHTTSLDLDETFAICSYVPPWEDDNIKLARESFKNVFTYYPYNSSATNLFKKRIKKLYLKKNKLKEETI